MIKWRGGKGGEGKRKEGKGKEGKEGRGRKGRGGKGWDGVNPPPPKTNPGYGPDCKTLFHAHLQLWIYIKHFDKKLMTDIFSWGGGVLVSMHLTKTFFQAKKLDVGYG
jgi:hypothetical protein